MGMEHGVETWVISMKITWGENNCDETIINQTKRKRKTNGYETKMNLYGQINS